MTIAPVAMRFECARTMGSAVVLLVSVPDLHLFLSRLSEPTDTHDDKEARTEAPQIQHGSARALDKVIGIGTAAAYPVGDGGYHVGSHDQEWIVHLP